jgi:hypothetical protein
LAGGRGSVAEPGFNALAGRGVAFASLHEGIDTTTSTGRLIFHIFAALAEFERELIAERAAVGRAAVGRAAARAPRPARECGHEARHAYGRGKNAGQMIPGWPYSFVAALGPGRLVGDRAAGRSPAGAR